MLCLSNKHLYCLQPREYEESAKDPEYNYHFLINGTDQLKGIKREMVRAVESY